MHIKPTILANGQTMHGIFSGDKLIATVDTHERAFAFVFDIDTALRAERLRHVQTINDILSGELS